MVAASRAEGFPYKEFSRAEAASYPVEGAAVPVQPYQAQAAENMDGRTVEPLADGNNCWDSTKKAISSFYHFLTGTGEGEVVGSLTGRTARCLSKTWLNPDNASLNENCLIRVAGRVFRCIARFGFALLASVPSGLVGLVVNVVRCLCKLLQALYYTARRCCNEEYTDKAVLAWRDCRIAFYGAFADLTRGTIGFLPFALVFAFDPGRYRDGLAEFKVPFDMMVTYCVVYAISLLGSF